MYDYCLSTAAIDFEHHRIKLIERVRLGLITSDKVVLDFKHIEVCLAIYFNYLISALIDLVGIDEMNHKIKFSNLTGLNLKVFNLAKQHVYQYRCDVAYRAAIDAIWDNIEDDV